MREKKAIRIAKIIFFWHPVKLNAALAAMPTTPLQ
jgi:hypothetical protein